MTHSPFWGERRDEFLKYSAAFASLSAHWRASWGRWVLLWGSPPDVRKVPPASADAFKAVAQKAVTQLPPGGSDEEAWQTWLDYMRTAGKCEPQGSQIMVTEEEWNAGVKDGKPLVEVRRELGPSADGQREPYRWIQDQRLSRVFEASASFCEELSARELVLVRGANERSKESRRERMRREAVLKLLSSVRSAAESELRKQAANAIARDLPRDRDRAAQVLWPTLSKYASMLFDTAAEKRLEKLGPRASVEKYLRWLESDCVPAVVDDACAPILGQFHRTVEHVSDILGTDHGAEEIERTKRALAGLLTEVMSSPHTEDLANRLTAHLNAEIGRWQVKAIQLASVASPEKDGSRQSKSPERTANDSQFQVRKLNTDLITKWMKTEGYTSTELASRLRVSGRAVSSMRRNGKYHGEPAITKLANLMERDADDLYLA